MKYLLLLFAIGLLGTCIVFFKWQQFKTAEGRILSAASQNYQLDLYNRCIVHLMNYEGFSATPYKQGDHYYIGYGHQIRPGEVFTSVTQVEALHMLHADFQRHSVAPDTFTDVKRYAIALFCFNLGVDTWNNSTMARMLDGSIPYNEHTFRAVWLSYCKFDGKQHPKLRERREFELKLFKGETK